MITTIPPIPGGTVGLAIDEKGRLLRAGHWPEGAGCETPMDRGIYVGVDAIVPTIPIYGQVFTHATINGRSYVFSRDREAIFMIEVASAPRTSPPQATIPNPPHVVNSHPVSVLDKCVVWHPTTPCNLSAVKIVNSHASGGIAWNHVQQRLMFIHENRLCSMNPFVRDNIDQTFILAPNKRTQMKALYDEFFKDDDAFFKNIVDTMMIGGTPVAIPATETPSEPSSKPAIICTCAATAITRITDFEIDGFGVHPRTGDVYMDHIESRFVYRVCNGCGDVSTVAGTGKLGFEDGDGVIAQFQGLGNAMAVSSTDLVFLSNSTAHSVRCVDMRMYQCGACGQHGSVVKSVQAFLLIDTPLFVDLVKIVASYASHVEVTTICPNVSVTDDGSVTITKIYSPCDLVLDEANECLYVQEGFTHGRIHRINVQL